MLHEHFLHGGHGALQLSAAVRLRDNLKGRMLCYLRTKAFYALLRRARFGVFKQSDACAVRMCKQMCGALPPRIVIVRYNSCGNIAPRCNIRINSDHNDAGGTCVTQHIVHSRTVNGIDEEYPHPLRNERTNLLNLPIGIEGRIARDEDIAVVLNHGADLLINDLIEGIVRRHVDGAKLRAHLVPARGVIRPGKLRTGESREKNDEKQSPSP